MVSGTPAALSRRWEIGGSDPSSVPLSGPGRGITSAAVTLHTLATALCEKKAPLCRGERPCVVTVCLGVWGEGAGGSKILTAQLWHQSKQSRGAEWQKQDVIVSHSEKHCGRQRDNRSFNSTSSMIFLPAEIRFMKNVAKKQLGRIYRLDIGLKLDLVYLLEGTIEKYAFHVGFSHSFAQLERKCSLKALCVRFTIIFLMAVTAAVTSG